MATEFLTAEDEKQLAIKYAVEQALEEKKQAVEENNIAISKQFNIPLDEVRKFINEYNKAKVSK